MPSTSTTAIRLADGLQRRRDRVVRSGDPALCALPLRDATCGSYWAGPGSSGAPNPEPTGSCPSCADRTGRGDSGWSPAWEDGAQTRLDALAIIVSARAARPGRPEHLAVVRDRHGAGSRISGRRESLLTASKKPSCASRLSAMRPPSRCQTAVPDALASAIWDESGERAIHPREREQEAALVDDGDRDLPVIGARVLVRRGDEDLGLSEAERHPGSMRKRVVERRGNQPSRAERSSPGRRRRRAGSRSPAARRHRGRRCPRAR